MNGQKPTAGERRTRKEKQSEGGCQMQSHRPRPTTENLSGHCRALPRCVMVDRRARAFEDAALRFCCCCCLLLTAACLRRYVVPKTKQNKTKQNILPSPWRGGVGGVLFPPRTYARAPRAIGRVSWGFGGAVVPSAATHRSRPLCVLSSGRLSCGVAFLFAMVSSVIGQGGGNTAENFTGLTSWHLPKRVHVCWI